MAFDEDKNAKEYCWKEIVCIAQNTSYNLKQS